MSVLKIHGFERESTDWSSQGDRYVLSEVVLVETDDALDTLAEMIAGLPSETSGPGSLSFNPLQLTFTINLSTHPSDDLYTLTSVQGVKRVADSQFWRIPLQYMTAVPTVGDPTTKRKDQKKKKPDAKKKDQKPITIPWERPPIYTGGISTRDITVRFNHEDNPIVHTQGLPVEEGVSIPVAVGQHRWRWNIAASTFNMLEFTAISNKVNSADLTRTQGYRGAYTFDAGYLRCNGFSFDEQYESPAGSTKEYHYVTITGEFEESFWSKWDNPPLSLHTMEYIDTTDKKLQYIEFAETGGKVQAPWPLAPDGLAITPAELKAAIPEDFGVLQVNAAGTLSDLVTIIGADFETFFNKHKLVLPGHRG